MPILAGPGIPVVDSSDLGPVVNGFEESRFLSFRSLDGVDLIPFTGDEFIARWGITGLDMPPLNVVEQEYPGEDGAQVDDITVSSRLWGIPLWIGSNSGHRDFLAKRERVQDLFDHHRVDYRTHGGTFDIVASSIRGERSLRSTYVGGWEGDWQQGTSGSYFETVPLTGRASRPYWTGERWSTPQIRRPAGLPGLGAFPLSLSPSRTLGADITVTVAGKAKSYARIDLMGPAPFVEITGPGLYVLIPDGLAAGESAVIDTYPPLRATQGALFNGVVDWSRIAPRRQFAPVAPGDNTFNLDLGVAGVDAWATVSGPTLWNAPW